MLMGVVDTVMVGRVSPGGARVGRARPHVFLRDLDLRHGRAVRARSDRRAGARRTRRARRAPRLAARSRVVARFERADLARALDRTARARARRPAGRGHSRRGGLRPPQRVVGLAVLRLRRAAPDAAGAPPRAADRHHDRRRESRQRRAELRVDLRQLRLPRDGRDRLRVGDDGEPLAHGGADARARLAHAAAVLARGRAESARSCARCCAC